MNFLDRLSRSRSFNWMIGIMGLIAIPLLVYNLWISSPVDKIFAYSELVFLLMVFGTFVKLAEGKRTRK